jgi:hypothetical protein
MKIHHIKEWEGKYISANFSAGPAPHKKPSAEEQFFKNYPPLLTFFLFPNDKTPSTPLAAASKHRPTFFAMIKRVSRHEMESPSPANRLLLIT